MSRFNPSRRGITLVELLVVIAILAVLAALALPAYQAARQRGNVARSINNMKQIHLALQLYAETHGQNSPLGFGLPHRGLSTLRDLDMIPSKVLRTGGTDVQGPGTNSDAYVWFPPYFFPPGVIPPEELQQHLREWHDHVERTQGNPVFMLDQTHNSLIEIRDTFHPKLCIVLWSDGQVQTTRRTGLVTTSSAWERR